MATSDEAADGEKEGDRTSWEGFEEFLLDDDPHHVLKKANSDGLKASVWKILHHRFCETLIVVLVFADIILLAVESGIDHHLLCINGHVVDRADGIPAAHLASFRHTALRLNSMSNVRQMQYQFVPEEPPLHPEAQEHVVDHHHDAHHDAHTHDHGLTDKVLICEMRDGHHAHHIVHWCHMASITILVLFLVEIMLKFWVKPKEFLGNKFMVVDALIVVVSLLIDTVVTWYVMSHSSRETAEENRGTLTLVVAVLLFVRLWRVVRIVHGLLNYIHEHSKHTSKLQAKHDEHKKKLQEFKELCSTNRVSIPDHLSGKAGDSH